MFKIKIIKKRKKQGIQVGISLDFQTLKTKQKLFEFRNAIWSGFCAIQQYFNLKLQSFRIILRILQANPQTISLKTKEKENKFFLSWEESSKLKNKKIAEGFHLVHSLFKAVFKNFRKQKIKIAKGVAAISIIALILQLSFSLIPFTKANNGQGLCAPVDVDVVLIMDTTGSMDGGNSSSKCEWKYRKWIDNEFGGSWQCKRDDDTEYDKKLTLEECELKGDLCCSVLSWSNKCYKYTPEIPKKIDAAKDAAIFFIDKLGINDQSALVSFNTTATLEKILSNEHSATQTAINGLIPQPGTETNIADAIDKSNTELTANSNPQAIKAIILLTDGKDSNADDIIARTQEATALGYKIFTIGLGSGADPMMLQSIAASTLAKYHFAETSSDLAGIYEEIAEEICEYGSISGCKYLDADADGDITEDEKLADPMIDWEIVLSSDFSDSQLTDENGCYKFAGLVPGTYMLDEILPEEGNWIQTVTPTFDGVNPIGWGEHITNMDFGNYLPICGNNVLDENEECDDGNLEDGDGCSSICEIEPEPEPEPEEPVCGNGVLEGDEECDDGNTDDNDGCSSICQIEEPEPEPEEPVCGNGILEEDEKCDDGNTEDNDGCSSVCQIEEEEPEPEPEPTPPSGGGGIIPRSISNVKSTDIAENSITITWQTTFFATSQVIYSIEDESHNFNPNEPPNYGYAHITPEYDTNPKVTYHTVTITELNPDITYHYRTISRSSPPIFSNEYTFTTLAAEDIIPEKTEEIEEEIGEEDSLEEINEQLNGISGKVNTIREEIEKILPREEEPLEQVSKVEEQEEPAFVENMTGEEEIEKEIEEEEAKEETKEETAGLEKEGLLATIGAVPFNTKIILIILGIIILALIILRLTGRLTKKNPTGNSSL
ncbi:DUF4215 domain-containing protein [Candidatus Parcubacteria bacterium]|nr:DUF4215 domain-containing protein [Candidatus Parcubacteria bacterium]